MLSISLSLSLYAHTPCERLIQCDDLSRAMVGVHIVDVDTREVVASCNADKALVPASLVKLFTAVAVMKSYDDTNRWCTHVGYTGSVVDSVLHGDVVVRGSIDPSLGYSGSLQPSTLFLDSLVAVLLQADIRHITGRIVVDASLCAMGGWNEWMAEDMGFYYGAACFGANYRGNEYNLYLRTDSLGTQPCLLGTSMPTPDMIYHNHLAIGSKNSAEVYTMPYMRHTVLMGTLPAHRDSVALRCAMPDAPLFMAHDIHHALQEAGVMIEGAPTTDRILLEEQCEIPAIENILYAHHSDPLGEM
ncbi:MAG: D-alanyl-D-alanine carboxypeptidase, partial [Bacteroidales bacterium]|nr:D-alanyl-D-alanine carboxypeptidase [Bacteroidales bacterium]